MGFGRHGHGVGFFWLCGDLLQDLRAWGHEVAAGVLDVGQRQHVLDRVEGVLGNTWTTGLVVPNLSMIISWVCLICSSDWKRTVSEPLPRVELTSTPMEASKVEVSIWVHLPLMRAVRRWLGDLGDLVVEAYEQILEARLGQDPGDQFGSFLLAVR